MLERQREIVRAPSVEISSESPAEAAMPIQGRQPEPYVPAQGSNAEGSASSLPPAYGPVRRVSRKSSPPEMPLHRPVDAQPEDFLELMQEVVPRLIQGLGNPGASEPSEGSRSSPRSDSHKREASAEPSDMPPGSRPRHGDAEEALSSEWVQTHEHLYNSHVEVLLASFLQKRMQKELSPTGNEPCLQARIEEAKTVEWETIQGKQCGSGRARKPGRFANASRTDSSVLALRSPTKWKTKMSA